MNRRTALKNCFIVTAGVALIPSCLQSDDGGKPSQAYSKLPINAKHEAMMAALADTLIPGGDTPGAKDVDAHRFAFVMVNDCFSPDEQQQFLKGMDKFEAMCKETYGKNFATLDNTQRTAIVEKLVALNNDKSNDAVQFYQKSKSLILQGFTNSKYYMTKVRVYEMVPGRYHGCVPVKSVKA